MFSGSACGRGGIGAALTFLPLTCSVSVGRRVQDLIFLCYPLRVILKGNRYSPLYVQVNDSFRYSRIFFCIRKLKAFSRRKKLFLFNIKNQVFLEKVLFLFYLEVIFCFELESRF